ncbi:MAG TPA: AAA family ATPase, partial [Acidimicrobiales bacterium]
AQFWELAQRLLSLGRSVILESGFWTRAERDDKRMRARQLGVAVELRHLDLPLEERWRRIEHRRDVSGGPPITYEQLASWDRLFEPPDAAELSFFDH